MRRWWRRYRYTRLEMKLLELRAAQTEVNLMLENAKAIPDYVFEFKVSLAKQLAAIEYRMNAMRQEGI